MRVTVMTLFGPFSHLNINKIEKKVEKLQEKVDNIELSLDSVETKVENVQAKIDASIYTCWHKSTYS